MLNFKGSIVRLNLLRDSAFMKFSASMIKVNTKCTFIIVNLSKSRTDVWVQPQILKSIEFDNHICITVMEVYIFFQILWIWPFIHPWHGHFKIYKCMIINFSMCMFYCLYHQTSFISHTLACNKLVDHSDVVGAALVGTTQTTSSFWTLHLASMNWAKTTAKWNENH